MKKRTGLSKTQSTRYGGLIAIMCGRRPYQWLLDRLVEGDFIIIDEKSNSGDIIMTEKGEREFERLTKLAGLPTFEQIEKI
jgi:hypothetical protein|tara:strand:- start:1693 stop:1935 length:243 start_codon:yes stop_codon:yes gene_type:complete